MNTHKLTKQATSRRVMLSDFKTFVRKEMDALNTATIANRADAIERATKAFTRGVAIKTSITKVAKGITKGDVGRMWHELNQLEDAIALAGGVVPPLFAPNPVA